MYVPLQDTIPSKWFGSSKLRFSEKKGIQCYFKDGGEIKCFSVEKLLESRKDGEDHK